MPCLLIQGATGMGKTHVVRKFAHEHPASYDRRTGTTSQRVVCFQMPPNRDEKAFWTELLAALSASARNLLDGTTRAFIVCSPATPPAFHSGRIRT